MNALQIHLVKARSARDPERMAAAARLNGKKGGRPAGAKNKPKLVPKK